jgi:hypothetical protein
MGSDPGSDPKQFTHNSKADWVQACNACTQSAFSDFITFCSSYYLVSTILLSPST